MNIREAKISDVKAIHVLCPGNREMLDIIFAPCYHYLLCNACVPKRSLFRRTCEGVMEDGHMATQKKPYAAPMVSSEKVFEQAALACSTIHYEWDGSRFSGRNLPNLKTHPQYCGYHHS